MTITEYNVHIVKLSKERCVKTQNVIAAQNITTAQKVTIFWPKRNSCPKRKDMLTFNVTAAENFSTFQLKM